MILRSASKRCSKQHSVEAGAIALRGLEEPHATAEKGVLDDFR
jgi:hypothetical protein